MPKGLTDGLACGYIPDLCGAVFASRHHRLAIGAKGDAKYCLSMLERLPDGLPGTDIPELRRSVRTSRQSVLAIGSKSYRPNRALMRKMAETHSRVHIPELRGIVQASGQHGLAIGT